tara:strand:- start:7 stop:1410 length:1404 start_codon:yes stop_codon:yes gene_type:complete
LSKIEVDKIEQQSGTTVTVGGGACKTAVIDATTVTVGRAGGTVSLAPGASQSGFGRAGSVNWCSTIYTNSPGTVTAASGKGFFLNTTSGAITINLPSSPTVGDIVAIKDYANTFDSNAVTVGRGGSKIGGLCIDATLSTEGESITLIYADATKGWLNVNTDSTIKGTSYVTATGGTITTVGDFKIHTFTSSGCFAVSDAGTPGGSTTVDYLVVAGGGGGSGDGAGGGGAGGYRESGGTASGCYAVSPLGSSPSSVAALPVGVQTYPITVGAGGAGAICGGSNTGANGANAIFSSITSAGGGRGGAGSSAPTIAGAGGSGGGTRSNTCLPGGAGNTPPVSPPQGNAGGSNASGNMKGAGGGGATAVGIPGPSGPMAGGAGATSSINNTPTTRAGGGGGGFNGTSQPGGAGGPGGGGAGGGNGPGPAVIGTAGTVNTGGGGGGSGGGSPGRTGGVGGSGIVIIRYKFQN